ncbi:MAG: SDR family NAD(P)-dependent oxidoreductase [Campylobacterales bacterium]|nr:SDR family NAD(P)-dependent oxidoreductase [Campylobacterales bacterium]
MKNILITGVGSGLGEALAEAYLERGDTVYAIGRTFPQAFNRSPKFFFFPYDLQETFLLKETIKPFVQGHHFDLVILNAGAVGEIQTLQETNNEDMRRIFDINCWANKELIDTLLAYATVKQVVGISSGAAINGYKGMGAYAVSKASFNALLNVYAKETPGVHFTALAPGIIDTPMLHEIIDYHDENEYPIVHKLKEGPIQEAPIAASTLIRTFDELLHYESGQFLDVRTMK